MKSKILSRDVTLILIASFFYMACLMLVTPLIIGFSESLGASAAFMGLIGGLTNLCSLLCRPFVGNLADRISKHKLSSFGAALMLIASVGYILAFNPIIVMLFRIINGIGYACCSICMSTWMSNMLPKEKIGAGMGLYGTMNALSMAIAPAIGVSIYQVLGYRTAFSFAVLFAFFTLVTIQFVHNKGEAIVNNNEPNIVKNKMQIVDKKVLPLAFVIMLFTIPYCVTQAFLVSYTDAKHLTVSVSLFFPLYAAFLLVLRLSLKDLFDKLRFEVFLFAGSASAIIAMLSLTVMQNNIGMAIAAAFMAGGYGIMCSVCQSTAILLAGVEKRGLANSTYYIGLDSGMALGPIIGGFLYGSVDIHFFYPCLFITVPVCLAVYYISKRLLKN